MRWVWGRSIYKIIALDEVMRMGPRGDIGALVKDTGAVSLFLALPSHLLCTGRRWPSDSQEDGPHRTQSSLERDRAGALIQTPSFQTCKEVDF